jgi:hypothetical protein
MMTRGTRHLKDFEVNLADLSWNDPRPPPKSLAGCYPPPDRGERLLDYDEAMALVPTVMAAFGCTAAEAEASLLDLVDDEGRARIVAAWPRDQPPTFP